jgi:predicted aconitase with swiveling domain
VLLEAILCETAPAAIITAQVDSFFALKAIVAQELYGHCLPLIGLSPAEFAQIENGRWAIVENGIVQMEESIHA